MNNKIVFIFFIFLICIKIISVHLTNFNMFGDEAQYWLWSKNLDFGYFSKPPLLAWFISVYVFIFGDSFVSLKLLPSLVYLLTGWAIYNLCKNIGLEKNEAFNCSIIFLFIPAVSFSSFIISTDVVLLLFWVLSLNELIKIIKYQNLVNFVFLGVFLGLAFLSKYAAIYFILCMFLYILFDVTFRRIFLSNYLKFSLGFVCTLLVLLPNIVWNINNQWITLQHTSDNANFNNINVSLYRGVEFLLIQILMVGPLIFFGALVNYRKLQFVDNKNFLLVFSIPIFLIVSIEAIIVRANANWAAPGLVSFFIFLYLNATGKFIKIFNIIFNFVFCILFFLLIGTSSQLSVFDRVSGLEKFAKDIYNGRSNIDIKNFVVSDRLLFASLSYELKKNKGVEFYMPFKSNGKITNHFQISSPLEKNISDNFVFIGPLSEIDYLEKNYKVIKKTSPVYNFTKKELEVYEIIFN